MTVAVSRAVGQRRRGRDLRLDRQHGRQRRRLRRPGRPARRGDRPRGQDRDRQARPGADARRPGDRPPGATSTTRCGSSASWPSATRSSWSTRSTRTGSRARRPPPSRSATSSARPPTRSHPGRQRRQRHRLLARLPRVGARRRSSTASRPRAPRRWSTAHPVANPETVASAIRIGNPARWEEAMDAITASRGRDRRGHRRADPRRLPLARGQRGRLLRAGLGRLGRRVLAHGLPVAEGARRRETVVCVLTGHGLKDPDTALGKAPAVIGCENELAAAERAVFD